MTRRLGARPLRPWTFTYEPKPEDLIAFRKLQPFWKKFWRLPVALVGYLKDLRMEPHSGRPHPFWFQPYMLFWRLGLRFARVKAKLRRRFNDVHRVEDLPARFFYFPLHYSPELSITTMAPYFEDQLRALDLIRYHMPSDHVLLVKEHPAMQGKRPVTFLKEMTRMAGLEIADIDIPGIEILKRAAVVFAITGTAVLEALLLGRPAILLGGTFFSPWVTPLDSFPKFDDTIREALGQDAQAIRGRAVDCVARTLAAGYDFVFYDPHTPDLDPKYMMNKRNVATFFKAFMDHLRRLEEVAR